MSYKQKFALSVCGLVAFSGVFAIRAASAWREVRDVNSAVLQVNDWVTLASDPEPGRTTRVILKLSGKRYVAYMSGVSARRIATAMAGESVHLKATVLPGAPRYLAVRHVVGVMENVEIREMIGTGSALTRSTNKIRRTISDGARSMSSEHKALFTGLVIGDDRFQSPQIVEDFRASGISHLTAVSGQNVAFLLAAAMPILSRLSPRRRFVVTVSLIAWFVLLTRAEPSVLRAAGMSVIGAYGFMSGRHWSSLRILAMAAGVFLLIDPLLAWSVGWWLSVSASAGIGATAIPISRRIPGPRQLSELLGATLAAQIATMPISLYVFGRFAPLGIFANLLTVPVAGLVMLVGVPLGLISGVAPDHIATLLIKPVELGVWWIATVASWFSV